MKPEAGKDKDQFLERKLFVLQPEIFSVRLVLAIEFMGL